jgi:hypothetical protein
MLFSLLYMVLRAVLRLAPAGDQRDREVEILALRHQVKVLKRKAGPPQAATARPAVPRRSGTPAAQGTLVVLHRHPGHAACLALRAREAQVDLPAQ